MTAEDPHRLEVGRPEISPQDLELARQGIPSRTVSPTAIREAQELMARFDQGETIEYDPREPGGRLLQAHDNSPESRAMYEVADELARREAIAEWDLANEGREHEDMEAGA